MLKSAAKMEIKGEHRQETKSPLRAGCGFLIIIVLIGIGIYGAVRWWRWEQKQAAVFKGYVPNVVCPAAFDNNLDLSKSNVNHFEVTLHEGCFGGFVTFPDSWRTMWHQQAVVRDGTTWLAFWFANSPEPEGPFWSETDFRVGTPSRSFRLQGHGEVIFYNMAP